MFVAIDFPSPGITLKLGREKSRLFGQANVQRCNDQVLDFFTGMCARKKPPNQWGATRPTRRRLGLRASGHDIFQQFRLS